MRDVAALAGVSLKTVSRVVNQAPSVAPELMTRVLDAIRLLDYRPNLTATSLRRADRKTAAIGLLLEDVANPFSSALHRAVEDVARQRGTLVFAGSSDEDADRERELLLALVARRVDGLIAVPVGDNDGGLLREQRLGGPMEAVASDSVPASMASVRIRPRRLVLVGSVVVDVLMYVDRLPDRGGDLLARQVVAGPGGGFNVLVAARRLGMETFYGGRTGTGLFGTLARAALDQVGIAVLLPPHEGTDTGMVIGLVEPDGERTFVTAPGIESRLAPDDVRALPLRAGDVVYVSGYDLVYPVSGQSLQEWLPGLADDLLVAIDPGPLVADIPPQRLERVLRRTDLLSLSAGEAATLSGLEDPAAAAALLARRLAAGALVVVRAGARGCWLATAGAEPLQLPGRPAHVVDTTGAGDAHVAAFLARLSLGDDPARAAWVANVAASLTVERAGSGTGPTAQQLQAALEED
jgi:sugar/nucleoside kinase (ribokinase family)